MTFDDNEHHNLFPFLCNATMCHHYCFHGNRTMRNTEHGGGGTERNEIMKIE